MYGTWLYIWVSIVPSMTVLTAVLLPFVIAERSSPIFGEAQREGLKPARLAKVTQSSMGVSVSLPSSWPPMIVICARLVAFAVFTANPLL